MKMPILVAKIMLEKYYMEYLYAKLNIVPNTKFNEKLSKNT